MFNQTRELTESQKELEKRFKDLIGFKGIAFEKKPLCVDRCVRITLPNGGFVGIYRGVADDGFVLFPTMNSDYHPELVELSEKERNIFYWQDEMPVIVPEGDNFRAVFDYEHKEHLDALTERGKQILQNFMQKSKIIIPSEEMYEGAMRYFRKELDQIRNPQSD